MFYIIPIQSVKEIFCFFSAFSETATFILDSEWLFLSCFILSNWQTLYYGIGKKTVEIWSL